MALLKKGAEADICLEDYSKLFYKGGEEKVIVKHRIPKGYRIPEIDLGLRKFRTLLEAKLISDAKRAGVPTPAIYKIDTEEMKLIMEFVEGTQLKKVLEAMPAPEMKRICREVGRLVARLHKAGIVHGDLTTSNMILTRDGRIVFIDFGLGEYTRSVEERGVDLHLLKRALLSAHFKICEKAFKAVLEGYRAELGEEAEEVIKRAEEIEKRGRYVPKEERAWC
ncbi:MAG: Kae1-associated kinase Bud32 [Candidatus Hadarchaeales archaeon]